MRTRILIGFAALTLGAILGFTNVQAVEVEDCPLFCIQQYRACLASRPDTPFHRNLCERYYRDQCMPGCGGYL